MKIAVYLSAVPRKAKNEFKRNLLLEFGRGARRCGDEVIMVEDHKVVDGVDIAVLQGWIGMKKAPHLQIRESVINHQRHRKKHTLVIDSNLLGFLEPNDFNRYLRYSLDGIFPTTGYYFDQEPDPARWTKIKSNYNFEEKDWKRDGKYILICLQREGGWSMDGIDPVTWLEKIVPEIRRNTDRPIIIRGHPGSAKTLPRVQQRFPDIPISVTQDIRGDFDQAWATITYNSSPGVASLLWGVPTFVTDSCPERSQAYPWAENDLAKLEKYDYPDRASFYQRLAQCHFGMHELPGGEAWNFMRSRLP